MLEARRVERAEGGGPGRRGADEGEGEGDGDGGCATSGWAAAAAVSGIALHGLVDSFIGFTPTYIAIALALGLLVTTARQGESHAHRV